MRTEATLPLVVPCSPGKVREANVELTFPELSLHPLVDTPVRAAAVADVHCVWAALASRSAARKGIVTNCRRIHGEQRTRGDGQIENIRAGQL